MVSINHGPIEQIVSDYEELNEPFADEALPINHAINDLGLTSDRDRSLYITLDGALNRRIDADVLRNQTTKLWRAEPWAFQPSQLVNREVDELIEVFSADEYSFRYPKKDAEYWFRNAYTLDREYGGNPMNLLSQFDFDANAIHQHVKEATYREDVQPEFDHLTNNKKFASLGGDKVGSLWLQNIHMLVVHLYNIQEIASEIDSAPPEAEDELVPIPVDVQVAKVTSELLNQEFDAEKDRDELIDIWNSFFDDSELDPLRVDKPLWILGRIWDEGGAEYVQELQKEHQ